MRGTTRHAAGFEAIEASGAEPVLADPDRLGTLLPAIEGVSAICWLMGTSRGEQDAVVALHGPRLSSLLEHLVETPVRGFLYEGAGSVAAELLERGSSIATEAGRTYRMRVEVVERDPADVAAWLEAMTSSVGRVLGAVPAA
jgi:hypothetical protein